MVNVENASQTFRVGNSTITCDVCHKDVPESSIARWCVDICSIVGVGFAKESMKSSVLAGNYDIGCVFKPLRKFTVHMAYCGECRRRWDEELKEKAAAKRGEAGSSAKRAAIAFAVFVVALFCTGISGFVFGIVACVAALACLNYLVDVWGAFSEPRKMTSEESVKNHIENSLMKTPRVVQQLRSVFDSTDISQVRFPLEFLRPPTMEAQMFLVVPDPWYARQFLDGWYAQYESPRGYNEKGEPCRYEEIVVTNARFGVNAKSACVVQIPRGDT